MPTTTGFATDLITFSRGSLATVTDSNGYIKWAPHNLLLASEQFDASSWLKTVFTVSANTSVAPNGTTTADTLNEGTANSFRALDGAVTTISGANYTVGIFLKYVDARYINITLFNNSTGSLYSAVCFDVQNGAVASSNAAGTGYAIVGTPSITSVGNNWYYCSFVATVGSTAANYVGISTNNTNTFSNYGYPATFTGTSRTVYLWGAHLYRSDLGGMQANASAYPYYNPSTPKNLLGYSEAFATSGPWFTDDVTIASNVATAPNGSQTADSITDNTVSSAHLIVQSVAVAAGTYTFSIYAKASTWGILQVAFGSAAAGRVNFNLSSGSLGSSDHTSSITLVGDGWYRCAVTVAPTAGTLEIYLAIVTSSTAARLESFSGTGARTLLLWGAQLSDSASLDPYVGSYGAAPSPAAAYGPRLDYDPSTLAAKGLLVEEQRTNLVSYSDQFDNAYWTKQVCTVTANAGTAPDGSATADKVVFNNGETVSFIALYSIPASIGTYTQSVFAKAAGNTSMRMSAYSVEDNETTVIFDLSAGTITSGGSSGTITGYGNGWYRCTLTKTFTGLTSAQVQYCRTTGTGDGTNGFLVYGAQLEAGSFATSYIPTAAASVTRNADVASVATSQFPYSATEGAVVFNGDFVGVGSVVPGLFTLSDGTPANFPTASWVAGWTSASVTSLGRRASNVNATTITSSQTLTANTPFKAGAAFAVNGTDALTVNGGTVATQAGVTSAYTNDILRLGTFVAGGSPGNLNGHIRQITYIPRRLTNAELQARTA